MATIKPGQPHPQRSGRAAVHQLLCPTRSTTSPISPRPTSASSRHAAKDAIAQILINSRMCAEGHRPICQDTGIVTAFVKVGMDVKWQPGIAGMMTMQEMVDEGVRRSLAQTPTTPPPPSILEDPAFTRRNTGDNTPVNGGRFGTRRRRRS